jgi:sugar (pentulose or hexulose) kinase
MISSVFTFVAVRRVLLGLTLCVVANTVTGTASAQLFQKAHERRVQRENERLEKEKAKHPDSAAVQPNAYNPEGTGLRPLRRAQVERWLRDDAKRAERTGKSMQEVAADRIRRQEVAVAILTGVAAGLSGASAAMNTATAVEPNSTSRTGSGVSAYQQQLRAERAIFNLNYSTNPNHAPVYP